MDFDNLYNQILEYGQANPVATFAAAFVLVCFLIWRPKLFFIFLIVALGSVLFLLFVFDKLAGTGL